jgi:hypothetical protein
LTPALLETPNQSQYTKPFGVIAVPPQAPSTPVKKISKRARPAAKSVKNVIPILGRVGEGDLNEEVENLDTAIDAMERENPDIERPTPANKKMWTVCLFHFV